MAINTLEYAKLFQRELDKQILEGSTSGWMEENAGQVIYNGGDEIKIPKMSLQGLAKYDRSSGYVDGAVTFGFETHKLTQDRGRRFRLDAMDVDETNFGVAAANVASEFQRTRVIPEIDAYRYMKLAEAATIREDYDAAATSVFSQLSGQLSAVQDISSTEGLVVIIARPVYDKLCLNKDFDKTVNVDTFKQGEIDFAIKAINGVPVIPVPSARMKTAYTFNTDGDGGFTAADGAVQINWLICPKSAPIAIAKTDNIKIITPEVNQFADAWDVDYRKYHDIIIPENKRAAIAVSMATA